jgi:hypothetical protein
VVQRCAHIILALAALLNVIALATETLLDLLQRLLNLLERLLKLALLALLSTVSLAAAQALLNLL